MSPPRLVLGVVVDSAGSTTPREIADQVALAERYQFNFVLFDDGPGQPAAPGGFGQLDPVETAAFAGARTRAIGLVAVAAATHAEPYHLSNQFSSLDWGSSGRAGWLATLDASAVRARAYSAPVPGAEAARREADAVVDAARRLWDSWEDGALIADSATGRFLDRDKVHYVDVDGEFFRIRGPALMPRPPQGLVPVLARAHDGLAAADVTVVSAHDGAHPPDQGAAPDLATAVREARAAGASRVLAELGLGPLGPGAGQQLLAGLRGLAGLADGVLLRPRDHGDLGVIGRAVLPGLVADGTVVPPRPGQTLRDQLGLPRPASRYAQPAAQLPGVRP